MKNAEIESRTVDDEENGNSTGEGIKIFIPSKINDNFTRSEVLLGLELSGRTNTLTEASNLLVEICKKGTLQNEKKYGNAFDKFHK